MTLHVYIDENYVSNTIDSLVKDEMTLEEKAIIDNNIREKIEIIINGMIVNASIIYTNLNGKNDGIVVKILQYNKKFKCSKVDEFNHFRIALEHIIFEKIKSELEK